MKVQDFAPIEDPATCPAIQHAADLIGRRWAASILAAGSRGARRFSEYRTMVGGISDKVLAQRLKELEKQGLIERTVIPSTPVQIRYSLTPDGNELMALLRPVVAWSARRSRAARQAT